MKRKITILFLLGTFALLAFQVSVRTSNYFDITRNLDIFTTLFKEVNAHYVDGVDPESLVDTGVEAMLASLDPYTNFIPEEDAITYRTFSTGQYAGIGASSRIINNRVVITRVFKGYSAEKGGLKVGDIVNEINNIRVTPENISEVSNLLKGALNTSVIINVSRLNSKSPIELKLKRENISVGNVTYFGLIQNGIGYIRLEEFTYGASKEVKEAVVELKNLGATSIVLDVRGNPGGLLTEAINICNLFIPKGQEIVSTKGKVDYWNKTYRALNNALDATIPLAVLIDENSASAAEIVAGVIQDYDRGILIGRSSFGKGLVQTTRPLVYDAQIKVTTAKYYTPSGRCIQAIDYSENIESKTKESTSLSSTSKFTTKNGREVVEGKGLLPDIQVSAIGQNSLSSYLYNNGYLFNFANQYYYSHDHLDEPNLFTVNDQLYNEFIDWCEKQPLDYQTPLISTLAEINKSASTLSYFNQIENNIKELNDVISPNQKSLLIKNKESISELLSREIVGHYFNYRGEIISTFKTDADIKASIDILSNSIAYKKMLHF